MSRVESGSPLVSVLMPTYRQGAFVSRAIYSLLRQTIDDFELVVLDDGSDDDTPDVVRSFSDARIRYERWEENRGLGAALNAATALARGEFLAYLPSDDLYDNDHLESCIRCLQEESETYLAYGGVRWVRRLWDIGVRAPVASPTLHGSDLPPWPEPPISKVGASGVDRLDVRSGNYLALVQVVHRRGLEQSVRWRERSEIVSDSLEVDFWRDLRHVGAKFSYSGVVTCEWGDHPEQRHKIIAGRGAENANQLNHGYGLSRYRQHYRVASGQVLNWKPVMQGDAVNEAERYLAQKEKPGRGKKDGLRILLVGALGYNPDQVLALEDDGHLLAGLWTERPHFWETAGPLPFGSSSYIPKDEYWVERVREFRPDVIYGLLNWPNIPLLCEVLRAGLAPFVVHMKESPMAAMQVGTWPMLRRLMLESAGRVYISADSRRWFESVLGPAVAELPGLVMDGDLPRRRWMTDDWSTPISGALPGEAGEVHTVCVGRLMLESMTELADRGIHVHHYGPSYRRWAPGWLAAAKDSQYLHLHGHVEPRDWTSELSKYDAGWLHVFDSFNQGNLVSASWNDINMPARLNVYALAGLPWIFRKNAGHYVGVNRLATELGVGLPYDDLDELASVLKAEKESRSGRANMRMARERFTFDFHVPRLVEFFRTLTHG